MTRAKSDSPTRRLTESPLGGEFVVEVYLRKIVIRPKGCRARGPAEVEVGPGQLYDRLLIARAEAKRRERQRQKRNRG